jgi:hypothetical protein
LIKSPGANGVAAAWDTTGANDAKRVTAIVAIAKGEDARMKFSDE